MGVISFNDEIPSTVAPGRLFKALILDMHNLLPKIMPQFIKSGEILQGNGGPGSIKLITFNDDAPFKLMKHRIDELDEEKFTCKYTLIEGGELDEKIKSVSFETTFEPGAEGGSISKLKREFLIAEGAEVNEAELDAQKEKGLLLYQIVEAYLSENLDVYA